MATGLVESEAVRPEGASEQAQEPDGAGPPPAAGTPPPPGQGRAVIGLLVLGVFYTLYLARELILPIVLAALLSFLLAPIVEALHRYRLPRWLASGVVFAVLVATVGYGAYRLAEPAARWAASAPAELSRIEARVRDLMEPVERMSRAAEQVQSMARVGNGPEDGRSVRVDGPGLGEMLFSRTRGAVASGVLMLVLLYFLLASGDLFVRKLVKVVPTFEDKKRAVAVARRIQVDISSYLLAVTLINAGLGTAVGVAMHLLGMPNPVLWGVMAAVLNFIPYLGAAVGIGVVGIVALGHFPEATDALLVPVTYLALTAFEGNFITPTLLGQRLTLNPVAVFVGLMFWGWLWGIPGALLAVPLLAAFKVVCDHYDPLQPVGEFLGR